MSHAVLAALAYAMPVAAVEAFITLAQGVTTGPSFCDDGRYADAACWLTRSDVGLIVSKEHRAVSANNWIANHLGYQPAEMVGMHATELVAGSYTPSRAYYRHVTLPLRHREGHIIPMHVVVLPIVSPCADRLIIYRRLEDV